MARASVKVAPSDTLAGRRTRMTPSALRVTSEAASPLAATSRAMINGMRDAVNHAPRIVLTAVAQSIAASQNVRRVLRRLRRTPKLEPSAMPVMNAAAMAANAYVVGPQIRARRRVHATSYASETNHAIGV